MQFDRLGRREFITLLGGAAFAWPLGVRAQQPVMPVVGFLSGRSSEESRYLVAAFNSGLRTGWFVEGQSIAIEYRWAEGHSDRLRAQAVDLVRRRVAVIVAVGGDASTLAAKAATASIPIACVFGSDPVEIGLVSSLNRPGGNVTGIYPINHDLEPKRLELLHDLAPKEKAIAVLVNPTRSAAEIQMKAAQSAARRLGRELQVLSAGDASDIDGAFAVLVQKGIGALLVSADAFFNSRREQIAALATFHKIPTLYHVREFAAAGGLMSYGANIPDSYLQVGIYAGRMLKGENPANLPVIQPTKFELVINLTTAKTLGLTIPDKLLALADEVIE
jgi:putative tryptophan/tyrosine transport system substrate-binding protein